MLNYCSFTLVSITNADLQMQYITTSLNSVHNFAYLFVSAGYHFLHNEVYMYFDFFSLYKLNS